MFRILVCSDVDYEEIVTDVCWNDETVATINQDRGLENLEIEIFSPTEGETWFLPFDGLLKSLHEAKDTLHQMQKLSD